MTTNPRGRRKTTTGPGRLWDRIDRSRWQRVRRAALARDGFRCQVCGVAGRLEVDHITALADDPSQDPYHLAGLQTLCRGCHIAKTRAENLARRPRPPAVAAWDSMVNELMDRTR